MTRMIVGRPLATTGAGRWYEKIIAWWTGNPPITNVVGLWRRRGLWEMDEGWEWRCPTRDHS